MDIVGYRVREGKVQKKKTSTLQEQISFNEVRRGSSQISEPLHLSKKSMYVQAYMWNSTVIRGLFFSKVVPSSYLLNGWGRNSGDRPQAGQAGSWANQPSCLFFFFG